MNTEIELHDSTIQEIREVARAVLIEFSPAYIHKSEGRPGFDRGTGWAQSVRLTLTNGTVAGPRPALPQDVWNGELVIGRRRHENSIPIPLLAQEECQLRLVFNSGEKLVISADSAALELLGEATYVEEFVP